jgi:hypothetical protein
LPKIEKPPAATISPKPATRCSNVFKVLCTYRMHFHPLAHILLLHAFCSYLDFICWVHRLLKAVPSRQIKVEEEGRILEQLTSSFPSSIATSM